MANAIQRTLAVSEEIGIHALVLDAIDEGVKVFYELYGFRAFSDSGVQLYLPLGSTRSGLIQGNVVVKI